VADVLRKKTSLEMWGVDPRQQRRQLSAGGSELLPGLAHQLPFEDSYFDCAILANVYEHIPPNLRRASLEEIRRVLVKGGKLIGQLPNPRFPIEQHSRLPLMGFLPRVVQFKYWQIAPVSWKPSARSWFPVTISELKRKVEESGFETVLITNFGYPAEALPSSFQRIARLLNSVIRSFPFAWQFVFQKE
jgi:ubiquinone/menaquinone biosynthesis C-methylase UbiE